VSKDLRQSLVNQLRLTKTLAIGLASTLVLTACPSQPQVPENVIRAFENRHPGISPLWETQPYGYEAVFTQNGIEYEVELDPNGQWLETESEVAEAQFSSLVLQRVRGEYPGFAITKLEIELTPQGTFYEVEIEQGEQELELYFDDRANPAPNSHEDA
jgi:hypothetical protein